MGRPWQLCGVIGWERVLKKQQLTEVLIGLIGCIVQAIVKCIVQAVVCIVNAQLFNDSGKQLKEVSSAYS